MRTLVFIFLSLFTISALAQNIDRDTSFTNHSALIKERKKYPFIQLAKPELPKDITVIKDVVYGSPNGRNLHADVYYPYKKKKKPGVLLIHGGGWKSGDKSQNEAMAIALASKGFVAVTVEYRLSPEAQYPAAVHDVKEAVVWMKSNAKKFHLDKKRISILGVSAGGQLAALVGTTNNNKKFDGKRYKKHSSAVHAIINIDGVLAFRHPESEEGKVAAEWLGGTYEEKPGVWNEASALTHAGKNTPPVLFINSSNPRFHAGQNDFIKKLKPYNIYTEVHTIPSTPHTFWLFHPWFESTLEIVTSFLNKIFKQK